jgi:hypothetical protein
VLQCGSMACRFSASDPITYVGKVTTVDKGNVRNNKLHGDSHLDHTYSMTVSPVQVDRNKLGPMVQHPLRAPR